MDIEVEGPAITRIYAAQNYNFAISSNSWPKIYSWGTEPNCLGTGNEEEPKPISWSQKFLGDTKIGQMALGGQHAMINEIQKEVDLKLIENIPDNLTYKKKSVKSDDVPKSKPSVKRATKKSDDDVN